jgi:ATP-dependent Clp protease ATP-binding subunit ClpX
VHGEAEGRQGGQGTERVGIHGLFLEYIAFRRTSHDKSIARYSDAIATGGAVPDRQITPSSIVRSLDRFVIGQDEAKKTVATAVYAHFKKIEKSRRDGAPIVKSNMLLIGSTGTGKTLLCSTLADLLDVPFVTAEATSLAHNRYVNEEIEAILSRLVDKAGGDVERASRGIVFIDEIDKLRASEGQKQNNSGESVQHALLKIMEGSPVRLGGDSYIDTTQILFICGGAFVGLQEIVTQARAYKFISMVRDDTQKILDRLNSRVKPTDLVTFGLIPEFTGRLPIVAHFKDLTRKMLARIMVEPENSIYRQFQDMFRNEGVELAIEARAFDQIAELAFEYQNGARSLRGIFEEMMTPILYEIPDHPDIEKVVVTSLFAEPTFVRRQRAT